MCRALSCFKSWASLGFSARWLCSLTEFRISWRISLSLASRTAILVTDLQASRARYLVEIQSWWCWNDLDGFVSTAKRTAQVLFRLRQITVHTQQSNIAPLLFQQRSCHGKRWRCQDFPTTYAAAWFEPASEELFQTRTFKGRSTDWATAPRQTIRSSH